MTVGARWPIGVATVVALLCVTAAVAVWTPSNGHPAPLPAVESHGLDVDQAACLSYGLVIRHSGATDLTLRLGKYQSLDPDAAGDLSREIGELDRIPDNHPEAATELVSAFDDVASEGEAAIAATDILAYREAVTGRSAELAETRDTCLEVADFDVETLTIGETGQR